MLAAMDDTIKDSLLTLRDNLTSSLFPRVGGAAAVSTSAACSDVALSSSARVLAESSKLGMKLYNAFVLGSEAYQSRGIGAKDSWQRLMEWIGLPEIVIFTLGTMLIHSAIFWGFNAFLSHCYRNKWFEKYKIQGATLPNGELYRDCLYHCFVNHFLIAPLTLYFGFPFMKATGMIVTGPIPPPIIFIRDIIISVIVNDTLFYWGHLLLHHKSIYKYVHKQHHKFKINVGISSEYAHPVEHLFSNIVPVAGNMLMGTHVVVFWVWLAIRIGEIVDTHSGFEFKYSPYSLFWWQGGADRHEFHHSHNTGCYGSFTVFWDAIVGTDETYNKYRARKMENKLSKEAEHAGKDE